MCDVRDVGVEAGVGVGGVGSGVSEVGVNARATSLCDEDIGPPVGDEIVETSGVSGHWTMDMLMRGERW